MKHVLAILLLLSPVLAWGQGAGSVAVVSTVADLATRLPSPLNPVVQVQGYRTISDWGAGRTMRYNPSSTNAVDNGCVFATSTGVGRWEAPDCEGAVVDLRWFGAADDESDDTVAITAAAGYLQSAGGGTLMGSGTFRVSTNGAVATFTNLSGIKIDVRGSFVTTDLGENSFTTVALTNSGATATATWAAPHGLAAGRAFCIKDSTDDAFNGTWTVATSNSPTVLTFALSSYGVPAGPATAIARDSDIGRCLFRFDSCTNVDVGNLTFRGVEHPRNIQYRLGYRVIETRFGTTKVRGDLKVSGASYGWYTGEYAVQSWGECTDFKVRVWANSVGYPVSCAGSGHDSEFDIYADNVHRGGYFGGVKRSTARVWLKNFDVAGAILNHQPDGVNQFGCEDFTLRVYDTGTTEPIDLLGVGGTRYLATVSGYASTNEVRHKNLDIKVYGRNMIQTSGLLVQTVSSNHWIDGLTFGGSLDQSGIAATNSRFPVFVYATNPSETAGQFRDIVFRDWKFIAPADADGSISSWVVLANPVNDVVFDGYQSYGMGTVIGLPDGVHANTVPRFPDWTHGSYEAAQIQRVEGGMDLSAATTIVPMVSRLGSNDFTIQWVGEIPSGNAGLFAITTGSSATAGSFGASITNGNLIVRAYGASATDWVGVTATNWASGIRGKVASLGIVRTATGVSLWTDGHSTAGIATTSGTPPSWSDALSGTNAYIGLEDAASEYWGTVYRFAVWNYARADEFPDLAIRWGAGESAGGRDGYTLDGSTGNGGFEALGAGGADVFASWTEVVAGGSSIAVSTNAVEGTNSLAMIVDGAANFSGVTASESMVPGATYEIVFWSRIVGGTSGQIAFVGAAGGDYPVSIGGAWARRAVRLLWNSSSFSFKRWSLTGQTAEIDAMSIRRIGALCDLDWTGSPADRVTGMFPSTLGGAANRIIGRGLGISADRGNNSATLEAGQDAPIQVWASGLTGARTVGIQTNHAKRGDVFRIVRTTGDTNTLTVVGRNVATDQWLDVAFDGTSWVPIGYGYVTNSYVTPPTNTLIAPLILKVGTNTDPAIYILASNLPASIAYHGRYGADGIETGVGTSARVSKILATDIPAGGWTVWSNITLKGDVIRSNGVTLTGSLDSKAATNHTHDASNTVSGQFESVRLGSGTSDTDTFLRGGDTPTWDQLAADDIPNLPASRITSGNFAAERLGTGTATTNTFLQGNGTNAPFWGTVPSTPSPTNGIADAPADGIFYGRLNNAWTQPDISHLSGVSGWGLAWIDGTVADDVDALTTLGLLGGGPATIDSPATYAVRVGSGGTISTRHRLNLIASTGLSLSLSDDSINDESDVTVSIADRDWGDITSTSSGTTWNIDADAVGANEIASNAVGTSEIDDNAVTYAKIQNVTASRVLGRGAGSGDGDPEELTIGGGLAMTGTTIHTNPVVVAASKLVGRGSASGSGAAEEITIGPSLTMAGTTLDVSPGTIPQLLLVTTSETTDTNQDTTWRDVTPTPRSGMSATIASGGLLTGHVLKVEVAGAMTTSTSGDFRPELRLLLDGATSDYAITWIMNEPYSSSPYAGATWTAEATIIIGASGSPATVRQRSRALYEAGETPGPGVTSYSSTGVATGSLYTGEDNVVKLEYRAMDADMTNFKVTSLIVTRL